MQPLPPSPAFTRIFASSININNLGKQTSEREFELSAQERGQIQIAVFSVYWTPSKLSGRGRASHSTTVDLCSKSPILSLKLPKIAGAFTAR
jgi:hypothetical protein